MQALLGPLYVDNGWLVDVNGKRVTMEQAVQMVTPILGVMPGGAGLARGWVYAEAVGMAPNSWADFEAGGDGSGSTAKPNYLPWIIGGSVVLLGAVMLSRRK